MRLDEISVILCVETNSMCYSVLRQLLVRLSSAAVASRLSDAESSLFLRWEILSYMNFAPIPANLKNCNVTNRLLSHH